MGYPSDSAESQTVGEPPPGCLLVRASYMVVPVDEWALRIIALAGPITPIHSSAACYHSSMFNFGKPKTVGDWIVHIAGAIVAIFLIWWMLRVYVL